MGKTKALLKQAINGVQEPQWYFQWLNQDGELKCLKLFSSSQRNAMKEFKAKYPNIKDYTISCV